MSTYVLMRILESAPHRYELGMRILTLGRLDRAYDDLASHIEADQRVLDIGCGTGALTVRAARRGATVKAIDVNAQMLEVAVRRLKESGHEERVELAEMGVAELDQEEAGSFDVVMSGLCFSELSDDEVAYTLKEVGRILKPGGLVLVADEVRPRGLVRRWVHFLLRLPLVIVTYLVTQQTTHAVSHLIEKLSTAGFAIESQRLSPLHSFVRVVARKPGTAS